MAASAVVVCCGNRAPGVGGAGGHGGCYGGGWFAPRTARARTKPMTGRKVARSVHDRLVGVEPQYTRRLVGWSVGVGLPCLASVTARSQKKTYDGLLETNDKH